jgi:hypothetical protein
LWRPCFAPVEQRPDTPLPPMTEAAIFDAAIFLGRGWRWCPGEDSNLHASRR